MGTFEVCHILVQSVLYWRFHCTSKEGSLFTMAFVEMLRSLSAPLFGLGFLVVARP